MKVPTLAISVIFKWLIYNQFKFVASKGIKLGGIGSVRGYGKRAIGSGRSCPLPLSYLSRGDQNIEEHGLVVMITLIEVNTYLLFVAHIYPIDMDDGVEVWHGALGLRQLGIAATHCKLEPMVSNFVKVLCSQEIYRYALMEMGYDSPDIPIGMVTASLEKMYAIWQYFFP
ncbi:hypothetical protein Ahy_B07g086693 [Arachis hypogaea]|uniref:PARP alpha-helical domain-containing protein n=1 Tax=Arachis hypogaea TaxID=3818 RepID=A0A444YA89_ARAHY|nr:hypothetical protein Ahy_B07g086693 [Arachis hypogaea]